VTSVEGPEVASYRGTWYEKNFYEIIFFRLKMACGGGVINAFYGKSGPLNTPVHFFLASEIALLVKLHPEMWGFIYRLWCIYGIFMPYAPIYDQ